MDCVLCRRFGRRLCRGCLQTVFVTDNVLWCIQRLRLEHVKVGLETKCPSWYQA